MTDHPANLVHMGIQHDARSVVALARNHRTQTVIGDGIGIGAQFVNHDLTHRLLEARRCWGFRQGAKKLDGPVLRIGGLRQKTARQRDKHKPPAPWPVESSLARWTGGFCGFGHVFSWASSDFSDGVRSSAAARANCAFASSFLPA